MNENVISLQQLRSLIGRHVAYHGMPCQVIEVIEDGPSLVLQEATAHTVIQSDQYGEAHRRVAPTFTLPVWEGEAGEINPALFELLASLRQ